jgi:hypothetical protein
VGTFAKLTKHASAARYGILYDLFCGVGSDPAPSLLIYEVFVEGKLEAPRHLARTVHDRYFEPKYEQFRPRTIWSLSNAFTSAFKELDPIPQFNATTARDSISDLCGAQAIPVRWEAQDLGPIWVQ